MLIGTSLLSLRRALCRVLVGVLVFAQMAIAAYACPGPSGAITAQAVQASALPMAADCDQLDLDAANLCVEHCRFGQQGVDHSPSVHWTPAPQAFLYAVPLVPEAGPCGPPHERDAVLAAAPPPPHAILHCCFRS
jgi:hypothetical protein